MMPTTIVLLSALVLAVPLGAQPAAPMAPQPPSAPLPAMPPVAPRPYAEPPMLAFAPGLPDAPEPHVNARYSQDPADSTYREARRALNRGEWRRAASLFAGIGTRFPNSQYRADALYWQAFALYRIGGTPELREGLAALEARRSRFPGADSRSEASALETRIQGALAARGDAASRAAVAREASRGAAACDSEELSVRASALSALMRADPAAAQTQLERVLARSDECSVPLRKSAVMMLNSKGDAASRAKLLSVATSDASADVRVDAIGYLGRLSGDDVVAALQRVVNGQDEERVKRAAVRALGRQSDPRAKAAIRALVERGDASERLRLEALGAFDRGDVWAHESEMEVECENNACTVVRTPPTPGVPPARGAPGAAPPAPSPPHVGGLSAEDAAWLRGVYPQLESVRLKSRAASVLVSASDDATVTWLMTLIQRDEEPADVRAAVLARLGRGLSIAQLGRLYDSADNRTVRRQIVSTLGQRSEAAATDKLIEIVRTGTDPQLRRSAISALTRKNDPRTTQLLLEMIDR